ncbi:MAG TPA: DUF4337 domain-containing protein [Beijerinckiaceae bacterium]
MVDARDTSDTLAELRERGARHMALLIAALAALLAIVQTIGDNAAQDALKYNIDASNLWSFYQAKTIRQTSVRIAAELLELELDAVAPERKDALAKRLDGWKSTASRYESEPETNEGRKELVARAKAAEEARDRALATDNMYDVASAALQLAIVLASASVVVGVSWLAWAAGGLGAIGLIFAIIGWFAPALIPI